MDAFGFLILIVALIVEFTIPIGLLVVIILGINALVKYLKKK